MGELNVADGYCELNEIIHPGMSARKTLSVNITELNMLLYGLHKDTLLMIDMSTSRVRTALVHRTLRDGENTGIQYYYAYSFLVASGIRSLEKQMSISEACGA